MTASDLLSRITVRPEVLGHTPIIRDQLIAVEHVLVRLAAGDTVETILAEHPDLTAEDGQACLLLVHRSLPGSRFSPDQEQ
ncbi:MAG: DUF433 domain-containing protein [Acidobacteria bacterium]|nr:DUF433 domain-containing protein [Acidobacteriota bacterium]